jgi:aspartyl-tRNA(Asn)/glutamyl-tRNA(Gln) amidotransferase subunit A
MSNYTKLSFFELEEGFKQKKFKVRDVIEAYAQRMDETRALNLYLTETIAQALADADESDRRFEKGEARPLEGLPLAVKDNFCTEGILTTAGSRILGNFIPPYESTITYRLKESGAILLGKTNLDEFAMGSSTENSAFGPSINPWKMKDSVKDLTPGGSSGGSAGAVAARAALVSLGTDTGGSIRQPAAFCGLVGLKPTYGRCSRYGIVAFASSLDQAGPFARTVKECAWVFEHMAGHDPKDSTSMECSVPPFLKTIDQNIKGLKVGIPREYRSEGLSSEMQTWWDQTAEWLRSEGAEIHEVSLPHTQYGLPTYYIIAPAEASSNLARFDGVRYGVRVEGTSLDELYENTRTAGFGNEVKRRIVIGTYVLSSGSYEDYYLRSLQVRRILRDEFKKVFEKVDVLLTPTTPAPAFGMGEKVGNPVEMYLSDIFTVTANLAGIPGISLPVGLSKTGLPIGMQLLGPDFKEETLFRTAHKIEKAANFLPHLLTEIA